MIPQGIRNPLVYQFLSSLGDHLNDSLPPADLVTPVVNEHAILMRNRKPKKDGGKKLFREGAFVSKFITPELHNFLISYARLDDESATAALVSENSFDREAGLANKKARTKYPLPHPFGKSLRAKSQDVVESWYGPGNALATKHPDLCLTQPYPIVIEAKYVLEAGTARARAHLIETIYEALFYRGLAPNCDCDPPWAYEFAVALIYDGTQDATVLAAWNELRREIRDAIWNAANIFVMPLRGTHLQPA
jgi:hypothetical protein